MNNELNTEESMLRANLSEKLHWQKYWWVQEVNPYRLAQADKIIEHIRSNNWHTPGIFAGTDEGEVIAMEWLTINKLIRLSIQNDGTYTSYYFDESTQESIYDDTLETHDEVIIFLSHHITDPNNKFDLLRKKESVS